MAGDGHCLPVRVLRRIITVNFILLGAVAVAGAVVFFFVHKREAAKVKR